MSADKQKKVRDPKAILSAIQVVQQCAEVCKQTYDPSLVERPESLAPFILKSNGNQRILAIRGTVSLCDWYGNMKMLFMKDHLHRGFLEGALDLSKHFRDRPYRITRWLEDSGSIVITGHSRGAAIATLFLHMEQEQLFRGHNVQLITFGSPRCGDAHFVKNMVQRGIYHLRVVHGNDVVTKVPREFWGYRHHGQLWQLQDHDDALLDDVNDHSMDEYIIDMEKFLESLYTIAEAIPVADRVKIFKQALAQDHRNWDKTKIKPPPKKSF